MGAHTTGAYRYEQMFEALRQRGERGAFIPFVIVGDPTLEGSLRVIEALIRAGADALELGVPFSDPIADGPTVQAATVRALDAGATPAGALEVIGQLRQRHPAVPIGLLVYANLVMQGGLDGFYGRCAAVGVDSVLVADVPARESAPFAQAATDAGVAPVLIATPNAGPATLDRIAEVSQGYTYTVTRAGVTGARARLEGDQARLVAALRERGAAPPVLGFGISQPEHVRAALEAGAAGAISGSAIVSHLEGLEGGELGPALEALSGFVARMKAATR